MKSAPIRYGTRFGCRFGQPHDWVKLDESLYQIWEKCKVCNKSKRWTKGYKGRIKNEEYLKDHVRQYAQDFGSTKRVFKKLYKPEEIIIYL